MLMKLSQCSAAWWVCVAVPCVLGASRTNTYTQAQNYRLGVPNDCSYATKALTEVIFETDNTDAQASDPVFLACPDE